MTNCREAAIETVSLQQAMNCERNETTFER